MNGNDMPDLPIELAPELHFTDRVSPGRRIAYKVRECTPEESLQFWLVVRDIGHESPVEVRRCPLADNDRHGNRDNSLAWAPDGRGIYLAQGREIDFLDLETGEIRCIWKAEEEPLSPFKLSCSPSGNVLIFEQGWEDVDFLLNDASEDEVWSRICRVDADGKNFQVLLETVCSEGVWDISPFWEQNLLVYSPCGTMTSDIHTMPLTGGESRRLRAARGFASYFDLCPENSHLFGTVCCDSSLWMYNLQTRKSRVIAKSCEMSTLSPDGKWLAFHDRDYDLEVLDMAKPPRGWQRSYPRRKLLGFADLPDKDSRRGPVYISRPCWSADSRYLFFGLMYAGQLSRSLSEKQQEFLAQLPEGEQAAARRNREEQVRIEDFCYVGVIDFETGGVWMEEGYWSHVAWSPVCHNDDAFGVSPREEGIKE